MVTTQPDEAWSHRAIGAIFLFVFGGAWLVSAAFQAAKDWRLPAIILIVVCTAALCVFTYRRYRTRRPAQAATSPSYKQRGAGRAFNIINATQWVAILVTVGVLANFGLYRWIVPGIMVIVGLHFVPLARIFRHPLYYATGAALVILAVAYPVLAPRGPTSPIGCFGAGLILWVSAFWSAAR